MVFNTKFIKYEYSLSNMLFMKPKNEIIETTSNDPALT